MTFPTGLPNTLGSLPSSKQYQTVRGVKDVAIIDDAVLGSADARKLDEYAAKLQEAYWRPGLLRRADHLLRIALDVADEVVQLRDGELEHHNSFTWKTCRR